MNKYVKVTRNDADGCYTVPAELLKSVIDDEFYYIVDMPSGDSITLTVIEMTEEEYDKLPEFQGW
jgi:hypothetical protein